MFELVDVDFLMQSLIHFINRRFQSNCGHFLSLKVDDELIELFLQPVVVTEVKPVHDGFRDDVLSEVVEERHEVMIARKLFDQISLLIDVNRLILIVVVTVILLVKSSKDLNDDVNELFQVDQVLVHNGLVDALDLFLKLVPLEDVQLGQVLLVVELQLFKVLKEVFQDLLFLVELFLHLDKVQIQTELLFVKLALVSDKDG